MKNLLCVRVDNMGDVLMSSPAIKAVKDTFECSITLLTSSMGTEIARFIPSIDEIITFDVPWVRLNDGYPGEVGDIVNLIKEKKFDGAVIFTTFSQNPLPTALLIYLAGIPLRLAYCRENPYALLTHWIPDEEPYSYIRHQVRRDLDLVSAIGAHAKNERIAIQVPSSAWDLARQKMSQLNIDIHKPWVLLHPAVSEKKREYPMPYWIEIGKRIRDQYQQQIVLTGSGNEKFFIDEIKDEMGINVFSLAGLLTIEEFISVVAHAPLVISVNTVTIHIAAATGTPVIVLYALTNPQHAPWKVPGKVLLFDVEEQERSKNEILKYVRNKYFPLNIPSLLPDEVIKAVEPFLKKESVDTLIPEMISF